MAEFPKRIVFDWQQAGVEMAFRLIPAGSFRMGSRGYHIVEEPVHLVNISEAFFLAETPVTQAQFALWTKSAEIDHTNHFDGRPNHPAENMTWHEAVAFCDWLTETKAAEVPDGLRVCLPSEAQWEYACRGHADIDTNKDTEYHTGDGEEALERAGWYDEDIGSGSTHRVGQKEPNEFGLYDMHGNVDEWCRDAWKAGAYRGRVDGECDPEEYGEGESQQRVLRGGSWSYTAFNCRSACRIWYGAGLRFGYDGFRCCLARSPAAAAAEQ